MNEQRIFTPSKEYIGNCLYKGFVFWVAFNLVTGLITGDFSLDDNYFVLTLIALYIGFLASYKIKVDRGHITTYQLSMVTNNINLFKASKVVNDKKRLTVYYPEDARFSIKYFRVSQADQAALIKLVTPQEGVRASAEPVVVLVEPEKAFGIFENSKFKYVAAIYNVVVGISFMGIGVVFIYNGAIQFPGTTKIISIDSSPDHFYMVLTFIALSGVAGISRGVKYFKKKVVEPGGVRVSSGIVPFPTNNTK